MAIPFGVAIFLSLLMNIPVLVLFVVTELLGLYQWWQWRQLSN